MKHISLIARPSSWAPGRWPCGILVSLVVGSIPVCAPYALGSPPVNFPGEITVQDGKLTAHIVGASLQHVFEEVSRLSGAQVRWIDAESREQAVSVEFTALPMADGVRRLLRATNFLLVYIPSNEGTRLTQIRIASRGDGGPPGRDRSPAPHAPPLPAAEEPAAAVEQSLEAPMETATGDAEMASRLSAIEELSSAVPQDARVREILWDLADHDPHPPGARRGLHAAGRTTVRTLAPAHGGSLAPGRPVGPPLGHHPTADRCHRATRLRHALCRWHDRPCPPACGWGKKGAGRRSARPQSGGLQHQNPPPRRRRGETHDFRADAKPTAPGRGLRPLDGERHCEAAESQSPQTPAWARGRRQGVQQRQDPPVPATTRDPHHGSTQAERTPDRPLRSPH